MDGIGDYGVARGSTGRITEIVRGGKMYLYCTVLYILGAFRTEFPPVGFVGLESLEIAKTENFLF